MNTRYPVLVTLVLILIMTLGLSSAGCDRLVQISGKVYEWVDPPERASSLVFHKEISAIGILKEDIPPGLNLQPLKDVRVSAFGQYKTETFYSNEITDIDGKYRLIISLGYKMDSYDTTVSATHPGFMAVKRLITDVGENHVVTIVLVRQAETTE